MKFELKFVDRVGNPVDGLKYKVSVSIDKSKKTKRELVSFVSKNGQGKGATIIGIEELIFEVVDFPTPYTKWTEVGYFSYKKRMDKNEKRTIVVKVPSILINTKTFPKQEMKGDYERKKKMLEKQLDSAIYLYPSVIKHKVVQGESLESIANKHQTTVSQIKKKNKITGNLIKIGDQLTIKDDLDVRREVLDAQKVYRKHIKENFEVSKNNSKVIITVKEDKKGTQLLYVNVSGAIAAVIGVGASIQVGVARTPKDQWGIFVAPGVAGVQGTPSVSVEGGYLLSEAKSLDDLAGFGYSMNVNTYALVGASTVVASGLTPEKIFDGDFSEGTTVGGGLEAGVGMGANIQHNLSYTFVIPLTK